MFVIGLSPRLADPEVLKKNEYFGKYGRIYKVVINNHTVYNGAQVHLVGGGGGGEEGREVWEDKVITQCINGAQVHLGWVEGGKGEGKYGRIGSIK